MTETTGEVRVRNVRTRRNDSFMESAMEFGGGVVRLGFTVFTLPLALLPPESRNHMRNATKELMYAFASLPRDFADIAGEAIEDWAAEKGEPAAAKTKAPKDEMAAG
ncbi:MAG: hypothetical protein HXY37_06375 [Chloroflexi bacterium]|nr:hypothetical protein [Chloroflexota bacterium]